MRIRIGILTKVGLAMFLGIIILRIWFDIPLAIAAIPIFIEWVVIPIIAAIFEFAEDSKRVQSFNKNYYNSGRTIHWDYKSGKMFEDSDDGETEVNNV